MGVFLLASDGKISLYESHSFAQWMANHASKFSLLMPTNIYHGLNVIFFMLLIISELAIVD